MFRIKLQKSSLKEDLILAYQLILQSYQPCNKMPRKKAFDQEKVLDKAKNLFWEKGFYATSMHDLVSNLGINRASLYDTFGNKELLFEKALIKYKTENLTFTADFLYQQLNVRQGLMLLLQNKIERAINEKRMGCFISNTTTELANTNKRVTEILQAYQLDLETIYYNYLQYGINQGQISPYKDIKSLASYLYSLETGLQVMAKLSLDKNLLIQTIAAGLSVLD